MKFYRLIFFFLLATLLFSWTWPRYIAQASPESASKLDSDEIAVMAVVLDAAYALASPGWVMLASRTATFKCNPPSNIGLDVGGCNGMRDASETAEERLALVRKEMPVVSAELATDLIRKSRESSILSGPLPIPVQQVMYAPDSKTDLKFYGTPAFVAYFSRVGLDSERVKALIYVGTINWTDRSKSMGQYLYLEKLKGVWTIKDHTKVWAI